jgi:hypothetical protein
MNTDFGDKKNLLEEFLHLDLEVLLFSICVFFLIKDREWSYLSKMPYRI